MNTVLVWVLVTIGGYNSNVVSYSPPVADLATCQFLQKEVTSINNYVVRTKCIQISVTK